MNRQGSKSDIESLTRAMASSDEDAYRRFFDLYFDRLHAYHLTLNQNRHHTANETLQLTLMRVVKHIKPFAAQEAFWDWLALLSRCAVRDHLKKDKRYFHAIRRYFENLILPSGESDELESPAPQIQQAVCQLPEIDQDIIHRKYTKRQSIRQIANDLETTEKSIESRLLRARKKLRTTLQTSLHHD